MSMIGGILSFGDGDRVGLMKTEAEGGRRYRRGAGEGGIFLLAPLLCRQPSK